MKSVALYGFAPSNREGIWTSKADEIWSIAWAYKYNIPRIDRLVEIHPVWMQAKSKKPEYSKVREHWKWLKNNKDIPVYMIAEHPDVPKSVQYPLKEVMDLLPVSRRRNVFTSSFDFLMGLAVHEGFERIEPYGFDMGSDTEYLYQREGAAYWIGYCDAKGIEVVLPNNSALLRKKIYMYEGGAMIYRTDLERMKAVRERQKRDSLSRLNVLQGKMQEALDNNDEEKQKEYARKWDEQYRLSLVIDGALQECKYYLKEIDLEEPTEELIDPFEFIPLDMEKE